MFNDQRSLARRRAGGGRTARLGPERGRRGSNSPWGLGPEPLVIRSFLGHGFIVSWGISVSPIPESEGSRRWASQRVILGLAGTILA